jgi:phosphoribosylformylglycinamidine synthase
MDFITLGGESCFSPPEAAKLADQINKSSSVTVNSVTGTWVYYAHVRGDLAIAEQNLRQLLPLPSGVAATPPLRHIGHGETCYIWPRNISPWSSQATAVAHVVGFKDQVVRIERGRIVQVEFNAPVEDQSPPFRHVLFDRMTENFSVATEPDLTKLFADGAPAPLEVVDIFSKSQDPVEALAAYNVQHGLAMDRSEMEYLVSQFRTLGRPPNDVELFMFAQVNSEHCRHKQFNASWTIDGLAQAHSLFEMIRHTHATTPDHTVSAYSDNAAVFEGPPGGAAFWAPEYSTGSWKLTKEAVHVLAKVETHNHPTAIAPFPGAATGSGGEIRDEGAVGRGSKPKAGLAGFWVSDLRIPDAPAPWERVDVGKPAHYASSLDIMLEAPIGSARFNNEFGRPCLAGVFRTLLVSEAPGEWRGYHKPIMIAGGVGTVRPMHALKSPAAVLAGAHVVVLGGPAMLIGLGGGAASSAAGGENADLDFDSVQRGNPEMERRAQMVIDACVALGDQSPIAFIHDVGAGGLSNALPELVKDAGYGGTFELRQVESADRSMSPLQIWCNEAQERYVLLVNKDMLNRFVSICRRERCGLSVVGNVTAASNGEAKLVLADRESRDHPFAVDLPMNVLFPKGRRLERIVASKKPAWPALDTIALLSQHLPPGLTVAEKISFLTERVFLLPAVGSKSFLITIGDRSVGGLTVRDQMVGPWQTPVADVAVTATSFDLTGMRTGEAMAMGEKPTLALISPAASARMAVAEALLNLGAADVLGGSVAGDLRRVKLSANWMAAVHHPGEGAALYEAVQAIGREMCPTLGISIPVGKDSTSMKASWRRPDTKEQTTVAAPVSVVISAFTVVGDVRRTWTPQLRRPDEVGESILLFVDLAGGRQAMGGSALAQAFETVGSECPDVRDVELLRDYFDALAQLHESGVVLAYHDRSDGGLLTTVAEMMFAGRCGVDLALDGVAKGDSLGELVEALFNEELGAVFQVKAGDEINFKRWYVLSSSYKHLAAYKILISSTALRHVDHRLASSARLV